MAPSIKDRINALAQSAQGFSPETMAAIVGCDVEDAIGVLQDPASDPGGDQLVALGNTPTDVSAGFGQMAFSVGVMDSAGSDITLDAQDNKTLHLAGPATYLVIVGALVINDGTPFPKPNPFVVLSFPNAQPTSQYDDFTGNTVGGGTVETFLDAAGTEHDFRKVTYVRTVAAVTEMQAVWLSHALDSGTPDPSAQMIEYSIDVLRLR